jgi:hypothetical protein
MVQSDMATVQEKRNRNNSQGRSRQDIQVFSSFERFINQCLAIFQARHQRTFVTGEEWRSDSPCLYNNKRAHTQYQTIRFRRLIHADYLSLELLPLENWYRRMNLVEKKACASIDQI